MMPLDPTTKRIALWTGALVAVFLLIVILATAGSRNGGKNAVPKLSEPVSEDDQRLGSMTAPLTLVEYSDFQCPACGFMHPIVKQLRQEFGGDLQFVYRHFPLTASHPNAEAAAKAAEAAGKQGKFWEMHDLLFETQDQWAKDATPEVFFSDLANIVGLDLAQFKKDFGSKEIEKAVAKDVRSGTAGRIQATPTFFLNGQYLQHPTSFEQFRGLIQSVLTQGRAVAEVSSEPVASPPTEVPISSGQTPTLELSL